MGKRQTSITMVLAHTHAAYQHQAGLIPLAQKTKSQEYRDDIGAARKELDRWRATHWNSINEGKSVKKN